MEFLAAHGTSGLPVALELTETTHDDFENDQLRPLTALAPPSFGRELRTASRGVRDVPAVTAVSHFQPHSELSAIVDSANQSEEILKATFTQQVWMYGYGRPFFL